MNDFGLLVGEYLSALPTLTNGEKSELQLDVSGKLIISGRYLEDSAHASGDAGISILVVRNDADTSLVDTDGDYAMLQVDANGRLKVAAAVSVEPSDAEYAEDSAHTTGDVGLQVLAVRQDTLANSTSTDGDYGSFKINTKGELYVKDTDVKAVLDTIKTDTASIVTNTGTTATNTGTISSTLTALSKAEDAVHASGDQGIQALAVRNDSETSLVNANGDYASLQTNSVGRLKVDSKETLEGTEAYSVTDALAAAGDGLATITALATPWVDVAVVSHETGTAYLYGWQWGCDANADARIVTNDGVDVIVYKRSVNSSAQPSYSEHFTSEGRIEIAGATDLEIKLQIKKRSAGGGNALGTGSMHIRIAA